MYVNPSFAGEIATGRRFRGVNPSEYCYPVLRLVSLSFLRTNTTLASPILAEHLGSVRCQ